MEGDLCLFQPMTNGDGTKFTVMIHVLRKESTDHPSDRSPVLGSNYGLPSTEMIPIVRVKEEQSDGMSVLPKCTTGTIHIFSYLCEHLFQCTELQQVEDQMDAKLGTQVIVEVLQRQLLHPLHLRNQVIVLSYISLLLS